METTQPVNTQTSSKERESQNIRPLALRNLKLQTLNVRTVPLRMLSKLCCGLGNLLGLIGRERSNKESEPLHANTDLEGHENLGIVRC